jgi:hypothetical protein
LTSNCYRVLGASGRSIAKAIEGLVRRGYLVAKQVQTFDQFVFLPCVQKWNEYRFYGSVMLPLVKRVLWDISRKKLTTGNCCWTIFFISLNTQTHGKQTRLQTTIDVGITIRHAPSSTHSDTRTRAGVSLSSLLPLPRSKQGFVF